MPRSPRGEQPICITVATKVTEQERDKLIEKYGSAYAGLRAAIECVNGDDDE